MKTFGIKHFEKLKNRNFNLKKDLEESRTSIFA
jgi:hypothetical protein